MAQKLASEAPVGRRLSQLVPIHRLVLKARGHMRPCLGKNPRTGAVEIDPDRTSTAANIPRSEVPTISAKLAALARCDVRQLETFQVQ